MNAFKKIIKQRGAYMAVRQAKNLGVDFIDCYVAMFDRMPRLV